MNITDKSMNKYPQLPAALLGFEHIERRWDPQHLVYVANIKPGEFYVTAKQNEIIKTVLGSCLSACIRDKKVKIGGMNHFMLPLKGSTHHQKLAKFSLSKAACYGNWAMEFLINEILKAGGTRRNLEVKIFGGGCVLKNMTNIGKWNIQFILDYIYDENLTLVSKDVGGNYPRKILYSPFTGVVKLKKMQMLELTDITKQEEDYLQQISSNPPRGDIKLF